MEIDGAVLWSISGALLCAVVYMHDREVRRLAKNIHDIAGRAVSDTLFAAHIKHDEEIQEQTSKQLDKLVDLAEKERDANEHRFERVYDLIERLRG